MLADTCELAALAMPDDPDRIALASGPTAKTLRVLHVINGEHYSGAERVQDLLALNLLHNGFEVGFACLKPGRFAAMRQSQAAPVVDLRMSSRLDLRPALRLARLIRRERYVLVHTHTPRAALIGRLASALAGVPLVHHVHSPTANDSTRTRQDRWNARIERFSLRGVSSVIAVSHSLAGYTACQGISPGRISVVPNGVPVRGPLETRAAPTQSWTLGTVALFRPRKGLEVLLDAMSLLRSRGIDVRLRAAGDFETAEYEQKIHQRVRQLGITDRVHWVGFTQDVPAELARMDLFVLPSLFGEGLPMVILEAMAAGVPIVATRVEGVPEAIRDGIEGLIASPNDPTDLARAIARFTHGQADWAQLRVAAHQRQAERFSDRSMAEGVAEVYQRVLA
jgi:glycosyltransferase involved in cell wall biosynthesis